MNPALHHSLKAVIFDLDGVILDSMPSHVAAWQAACKEIGVEVEDDFFYAHEGSLDWEVLAKLSEFESHGFGPADFNKLLDRQREVFIERYAGQVKVFAGVDRLLAGLRLKGIGLGLVTSSSRRVLSPDLWSWLSAGFAAIITRDQVRRGKPHPEPYLTAVSRLGIDLKEALVVENAPAGIASAKGAGLTCLALATTLPAGMLATADVILADHEALYTYLLNHEAI